MKKVFTGIWYALAIFIIIFNLFSIFNINFFGYKTYKVISGSMEPTIKINDLILVKKTNDIKENDIITYKEKNSFVTHRVIMINNDVIITKGDANNVNDEEISRGDVIGKMVYRFKIISLISFLSKPIYLVLFFIIGIMITIFIPDKKNKIRKEKVWKKED